MSYIRCSTPVKKRKNDGKFDPISNAYAYGDGRYISISTGWKRVLDMLKQSHGSKEGKKIFDKLDPMLKTPNVFLTDAEMRHMCTSYLINSGNVDFLLNRLKSIKKAKAKNRK